MKINTLSGLAWEMMKAGFEGTMTGHVNLGTVMDYINVYDVPQRPSGYDIHYAPAYSRIAVPVSGGLDSTICWALAGECCIPEAYYVLCGQGYANKELSTLDYLGLEYKVIDDGLKTPQRVYDWQHILPARNLYILARVAEEMPGGEIHFGAVKGEIVSGGHGGDKSVRFFNRLEKSLCEMPFRTELVLPLKEYTKAQAIAFAASRNIDTEWLSHTVSCFHPTEQQCGACLACVRKHIAFKLNHVDIKFAQPIEDGARHIIRTLTRKMREALEKGDFSVYDEQRCQETMEVLG